MQKQKDFKPGSLDASQIDNYEFWDEIQIGEESETIDLLNGETSGNVISYKINH